MKSIILAGGVGSRLWPLSREHYPKQFITFFDDKSLFQSTIKRIAKISKPEDIFIATNAKYEFLIKNQLEDIGISIPDANIIKEPVGRGTLPAALLSIRAGGKGVYGMFPSDHTMKDEQIFLQAVQNASIMAKQDIVTFGVVPNCPHTGYGYIKPGSKTGKGFRVKQFFEKPCEADAKKYL
ncbi:MAG: mannose-1-phosphate guanylyltransferase/mannose-6-phosphate isomerase, partial [Candidatus Altiarchaeota archaeon]|nr:mannose-1-phosphate guanylyltransferase/mannose-6-phosphate isomerase [Candidatus Altiarchaeota archaeon]